MYSTAPDNPSGQKQKEELRVFTVIDPFVAEAHKEKIVVHDPKRVWGSAQAISQYLGGFGIVTRLKVEPSGFGKKRVYTVTAVPYVPKAARDVLLKDTPKPVGRHRVTGPTIKSRRTASMVVAKADAQRVVNDLQLQR